VVGTLTLRITAVAALGAAFAAAAVASPSAGVPTVKAASNVALGADIVVSSKGLTLYHYLPDTKRAIKCTGPCAILFPPLLISAGAKPVAGPGLAASKLGTVKRPDGKLQVTYNGLTLYRDFYDRSAGQVNGQGQQRAWYAVTPAGSVTKAPANAPAPAESAAAGQPGNTAQPEQPAPATGPAPQPPPLVCVIDDVCIPQSQAQ